MNKESTAMFGISMLLLAMIAITLIPLSQTERTVEITGANYSYDGNTVTVGELKLDNVESITNVDGVVTATVVTITAYFLPAIFAIILSVFCGIAFAVGVIEYLIG